MNREFLINIIFLISINVLIKPFYLFGIDRTVQNEVGPDSYGLYFALFNFTFMLQILNDFGIQNFNSKTISQNRDKLNQFFPNFITLKLILGVGYLGLILLLGKVMGYEANYFHLLFFLAINWILISFTFYLRSNIGGMGMYRKDSMVSVLDKLFMIVICGVLLWGGYRENFKIEWFVYAQTFSLLLTALIAFLIIKTKLTKLSFQFDPQFLKNILKQTWPYALVIFLMTLYARVDAVMVERMLPDGKYEAGVYASAYRLLDAGAMLGFLFAGLLLPMFSRMIKMKEDVGNLLQFSFQVIWVISISIATACYLFRFEMMNWLYTDATNYWGEVLGYLMISFVAVSGIAIFGTLLTANGSLKKMNILFVFGVLLNVIFNYIFIPEYKACGSAMVTCLTQFFVFFIQIFIAKSEFDLKINVPEILKTLFYPIVVGGLGWLVAQHAPFIWQVNFLIVIISGLLLSFILRLFKPIELLELVKNRP